MDEKRIVTKRVDADCHGGNRRSIVCQHGFDASICGRQSSDGFKTVATTASEADDARNAVVESPPRYPRFVPFSMGEVDESGFIARYGGKWIYAVE